ncbi:hypothetical protein [Micromonospora costi]|uniref:Zinc-finger domain-containing protein n=1 Tax=Micromonospora costi TaxID=1530042 RepID=A0A3B0A5I4_9ACTN|nr:hypothetical protein [Micromonospora costi]RKN55905.1 hypothetical protein D7193_15045 [Micromonospora costi]
MSGVEWRYTPAGRVKHALRHSRDAVAVCGVGLLPASEWRGTGGQAEYELVARLPMCQRCAHAIGGGR